MFLNELVVGHPLFKIINFTAFAGKQCLLLNILSKKDLYILATNQYSFYSLSSLSSNFSQPFSAL